MNDKFKMLALQAQMGTADFDAGSYYVATPDKMQLFAELIIQECVRCCEQVISDPVPESVDTWLNGGEQCIVEIKAHFGVEE